MLPESTIDKSVLLAKAMGWEFTQDAIIPWQDGEEHVLVDLPLDLYAPENMALAWRVLNWADTILWYHSEPNVFKWSKGDVFQEWWDMKTIFGLPPAEAQAAWLDKILELAIEAGLVEAATID